MKDFVILEIIPTSANPSKGEVIQLSALKLRDLNLIDRFDYRLTEDKIPLSDFIELISYDKENFVYKNSTKEIINDFKNWCLGNKLLVIDNSYTLDYLKDFDNEKESIFSHLNMEYNDNIIEEIINKYNLEESNYIVDLLYEALINESNNRL